MRCSPETKKTLITAVKISTMNSGFMLLNSIFALRREMNMSASVQTSTPANARGLDAASTPVRNTISITILMRASVL